MEVLDVDLSGELNESIRQRLRKAWHEHALLLFRNQSLSAENCERVASIFGTISRELDIPEYVTNVPEHMKGRTEPTDPYRFHIDFSFLEHPLRGLMLYGVEVPPEGNGGETLFADAAKAYELLPSRLRERVDSLKIAHSTAATAYNPNIKEQKTSIHPIAFRHPVTGQTILFCSLRHFWRVEGVSPEDSAALCDELAGYLNQPEIAYAHSWRPGDLLVWDNIRLMHGRNGFAGTHRRHLRRIQIAAPAAVPA